MKKVIIAIIILLVISCGSEEEVCKNSCNKTETKQCTSDKSGYETCTKISDTCNIWIKKVCKNNSCYKKEDEVACKEK